eukprot:SAG11_NODE_3707_length_2267_cov_2.191421_2_plen_63_part_00
MAAASHALETQQSFGNFEEEAEQTFVEIATIRQMLAGGLVDFGTLGMVMQSIGTLFDGGGGQ